MEYIDSIKVNGVITDLSDGRKVKRPKEVIISPKNF
jgi:hypothetical protein